MKFYLSHYLTVKIKHTTAFLDPPAQLHLAWKKFQKVPMKILNTIKAILSMGVKQEKAVFSGWINKFWSIVLIFMLTAAYTVVHKIIEIINLLSLITYMTVVHKSTL